MPDRNEDGTSVHSVQQDLPAIPDVETREETIARVAGDEEAAGAEYGGSPDPSTRRGVQRTLWGVLAIGAAVGFVIGAVAALILSFTPGPVETDTAAGTVGYMIGLGVAAAIVGAMLFALLTLAREDGRIERRVEQRTGKGPRGPGSPSRPEHDLKPR
ncbi:MAG: hypothetical protein AB7V62_15085 [Thermoleophilia bacterium]